MKKIGWTSIALFDPPQAPLVFWRRRTEDRKKQAASVWSTEIISLKARVSGQQSICLAPE